MTHNPKITIVLPTYNGSKYIRQSIDSCLNQTFKNFELIIIDDCSTDSTPEIIKSYADPRIKYIRNQSNQRLPQSLNIGFSHAQGKYLTWTSDDNIYLPNAIEKMVRVLETEKSDFVYADIFALQEDDLEGAKPERLPDSDELQKHNCIRACFLYTRKVLETVGEYDPDMELIEDYDYWVRVSKRFQLHHLKEHLYYYRYHPLALWSSHSREIGICEFLFKLKYDFMGKDMINWHLRNLKSRRHDNFVKLQQAAGFLLYKGKINRILGDFKEGKTTFTQTRSLLNHLVNGPNGRP